MIPDDDACRARDAGDGQPGQDKNLKAQKHYPKMMSSSSVYVPSPTIYWPKNTRPRHSAPTIPGTISPGVLTLLKRRETDHQ